MISFTWNKQSDKVKFDMPQLIKPWICSKIESNKLWMESKTKTKKLVVLSKSWQKLEIKSKKSDNKKLNMMLTLTNWWSEINTLMIQMENSETIWKNAKATWCASWKTTSFSVTHLKSSITLMKEWQRSSEKMSLKNSETYIYLL